MRGWLKEEGGQGVRRRADLQIILLGIFIIDDVNGLFDFTED